MVVSGKTFYFQFVELELLIFHCYVIYWFKKILFKRLESARLSSVDIRGRHRLAGLQWQAGDGSFRISVPTHYFVFCLFIECGDEAFYFEFF